MASEAQANVQRAVEQMLETIEKEKLRPLLREAHLGSARCCENMLLSKDQLEHCMQKTFQPAHEIQSVISNELNHLQDRLTRCAQQCQDNVQDKLSNSSDISLLQKELDICVVKCCDNHVKLIPTIMNRIYDSLKQFQPTF
ncbi:protein FAM136A [Hydra vulgaris]|uniref:Protein FAM136A n=1 Tax=Hydra vulgaris TaxID=6087 RepID=A0ABM4BIU6_HYDVU